MPRARNIKPAFFTNDILAECDPLARILFIGLWTISDREGRLEDRPKKIKAETLPYDNCDANALLNQLHNRGFIVRYEVENVAYIQIVNFSKHQNCHMKENASIIPASDKHHTSTVLKLPLTESPLLNPESPLLNPEKEAILRKSPARPLEKTKAERLRDDWELPESWGDWAMAEFGWDVAKVVAVMEVFKDHWLAASGAKGVKLNWQSTWKNWCRRENEGVFKK